jgi:hypothetical protein
MKMPDFLCALLSKPNQYPIYRIKHFASRGYFAQQQYCRDGRWEDFDSEHHACSGLNIRPASSLEEAEAWIELRRAQHAKYLADYEEPTILYPRHSIL